MDIEKAKAELVHEMKVTKGTRFNAAKRLERRDKRMITITAFASIYVIVLTVLPLFFRVSPFIVSLVNATTLIFSLIILASSLLQYSNNDPVRAEQFHRCALEVNALRRELQATEPSNPEVLFAFGKRYDEILNRYNINHDQVDFEKYKLEHPEEYPPAKTDAGAPKRVGAELEAVKALITGMSVIVIGVSLAAATPDIARILHDLAAYFHSFSQ